MLLAADTAPIDALCAALAARGLAPAPLVVTSLKDREADAFLRQAFARLDPALIVTTTAFAAGGNADEPTALDAAGVPVLQVISATTKRAAWRDSPRGLGAADLAMHVVLPELDGRVLAGAVAFKDPLPPQDGLAFTALASRPEPDRIAMVADRIAALVRLRALPRGERRVAILMPDYPGAKGRTGYAVGLDVPASVIAALDDLAAAGYAVRGRAENAARIARRAVARCRRRNAYARAIRDFAWRGCRALRSRACARPGAIRRTIPMCATALSIFARKNSATSWSRCRPIAAASSERRADYHDPLAAAASRAGRFRALAATRGESRCARSHGRARHAGMAAGQGGGADRGMLSRNRHRSAAGDLSVHRQQSGRGGAGQAPHCRRDHRPFAAAARCRRAERRCARARTPARRICPGRRARPPPPRAARQSHCRDGATHRIGAGGGIGRRRRAVAPDDALRRIDAWLCDLKDLAVKDGQHIYGRVAAGVDDPAWLASAEAERAALLAALDGARIAPGPAGAPARGRRDVLPTGRNLFTADPRTLPTPTAMDLGRLAADEVVRAHLQTHGEMPRAIVIDLWGSATLRTGGEEIAQGLALLGCRPIWEHCERPRHRRRSAALRGDGTRARRCHLAHFRTVPRSLPGADRADRRRGAGGRGARRSRRRQSACGAARRAGGPRRGSIAFSAPRPAFMAPASRICSAATPTPTPSARPISPPPRMPMAAPMAKRTRRPALSRNASPAPTCWCIPATIPGAIFSKAPRTRPSSAASRRPRNCSAVRPIS